jgi:hypothetical protein
VSGIKKTNLQETSFVKLVSHWSKFSKKKWKKFKQILSHLLW